MIFNPGKNPNLRISKLKKIRHYAGFFVSQGGIEPPTNGLKGRCSTT
jgi:hypothetical protein